MNALRIVTALAVLALVIAVVALIALASAPTGSVTTTRTFTTVITGDNTTLYASGYFEATGTCTAVSWVQPDAISVSRSTVTLISGNSTSYSTEYITTVSTPFPYDSKSYTTTSYVNTTPPFTVQATSSDFTAGPSALWTITDCTFGD